MTWIDADDLVSQREALQAQSRRMRGHLHTLLARTSRMPGRGEVSESLRRQIAETERQRRRVDAALVRSCQAGVWV